MSACRTSEAEIDEIDGLRSMGLFRLMILMSRLVGWWTAGALLRRSYTFLQTHCTVPGGILQQIQKYLSPDVNEGGQENG